MGDSGNRVVVVGRHSGDIRVADGKPLPPGIVSRLQTASLFSAAVNGRVVAGGMVW